MPRVQNGHVHRKRESPRQAHRSFELSEIQVHYERQDYRQGQRPCGSRTKEGIKAIPERCSNKACPNHNPRKIAKSYPRPFLNFNENDWKFVRFLCYNLCGKIIPMKKNNPQQPVTPLEKLCASLKRQRTNPEEFEAPTSLGEPDIERENDSHGQDEDPHGVWART